MASGTPSKILGTAGRRGAILPGMDADLVRLDGDLNVIMTVVGGTIFDENC
jgi:N-acetylglucosamine-6-phosphate deacetylase